MLDMEHLQVRIHSFQFGLRFGSGVRACVIAQGAMELDFGATAGTLVLQLQFIIANHGLYQLLPCNHPIASLLSFGSLLGGELGFAPACIRHCHYA